MIFPIGFGTWRIACIYWYDYEVIKNNNNSLIGPCMHDIIICLCLQSACMRSSILIRVSINEMVLPHVGPHTSSSWSSCGRFHAPICEVAWSFSREIPHVCLLDKSRVIKLLWNLWANCLVIYDMAGMRKQKSAQIWGVWASLFAEWWVGYCTRGYCKNKKAKTLCLGYWVMNSGDFGILGR